VRACGASATCKPESFGHWISRSLGVVVKALFYCLQNKHGKLYITSFNALCDKSSDVNLVLGREMNMISVAVGQCQQVLFFFS
jgi:predicted ferric reductase